MNAWVVAAMLASMLVQAATSVYELRQGRRLKSEVLVADALHTRASILVSTSVLAGLALVRFGYAWADPIAAVIVALVIAKIGVDVLRETIPVLVDQAVVDPRQIADVVRSVGGVRSFHRVRSRGAAGSAAVDLHVRISPDRTVQEADAIGAEIRRRLLELDGINDVTVHVEAQHSPQAGEQDLFAALRQAAGELGLVTHESWVHRMDDKLYLEMHVGVDPRLTLGDAHALVEVLEIEMRQRFPQIQEVHTHIEMADHQVQEGDRVPPEVDELLRREIYRVVESIPSLDQPHHIIIRQGHDGKEGYFISLECTVAADMPVTDAHQLSTLLERELSSHLSDVVDVFVHLEPPGSS